MYLLGDPDRSDISESEDTAADGDTKQGKKTTSNKKKMSPLKWIKLVLRSPLDVKIKDYMIGLLRSSILVPGRKLSPSERVVYTVLADRCPIDHVKDDLIMVIPESLTNEHQFVKYMDRADEGNYGIHIVFDGQVLQQLRKVCRWRVEECDFTQEYFAKSMSDSQMYLQIKSKCYDARFVYVKGLLTISDTLLKWCSEYTKKNPWQYIYFENTQTTWNVIENLDRVIKHSVSDTGKENGLGVSIKKFPGEGKNDKDESFDSAAIRDFVRKTPLYEKEKRQSQVESNSHGMHEGARVSNWTTKRKQNWEKLINRLYSKDHLKNGNWKWVLINGEPGIGKTYGIDQKKRQIGAIFSRFANKEPCHRWFLRYACTTISR
jgi:hypothetical protein